MLRLALDYIKPGMKMAKEVYDMDGRILLAAGAKVTERSLEVLKKRGMLYLYVADPSIELPLIDEVVQEPVRLKTVKTVKNVFENVTKKGVFSLSDESKNLVTSMIQDILSDKSVVLHLAHIDRHREDLFTHSVNVAILSSMTAVTIGYWEPRELYTIAVGALLHDIGYALVPKDVIDKANPSAAEAEVLKDHTTYGFQLLRQVREFPLLAAHVALQHHERFDGTGYPRKLAGHDIHKYSRIVSLANEYDNLVTGKSSQRGMAAHTAYEQIVATSNTLFDPDVAEAFLSKIALYPTGTFVRLTNGIIGIVTAVTPRMQHRPRIKLVVDAAGEVFGGTREVDLSDQKNLTLFVDAVLSDRELAAVLQTVHRGEEHTAPNRPAP